MKSKKAKWSITLFLIIWTVLIGFSIGKGKINILGNGKGIIAKPILIVNAGEKLKIDNNSLDNTYKFLVKNYKEEQISNIPIQYRIELLLPKENDLQIELYQGDKKISLEDNKTNFIYLDNSSKMEHHYQLKIKDIEKVTSDIVGNLQIKIHSEQMRGKTNET